MIWDSFQGKSKKEREEPKILYILTAPLRHLFAYKSHRALNVHPPSLSELNRKNNTDLSHLQPESRNVNFTAVQVTKISRPRVTPLAHNSLLLIINSRQGERCTGVSESLPSTPQQMDFQGEKSQAQITHSNQGRSASMLSSSLECKNFTHKCIKRSAGLNFKGFKPQAWRGKCLSIGEWVYEFFRAPPR